MTGVEITSGRWKFRPCQAKCPISKTNKTSKTSEFRKGWLLKRFPKGFKNAKIVVLEHLELKIFFAA